MSKTLTVVMNDERFFSQTMLVAALARIYNVDTRASAAVADVCDDLLDIRGGLLGKVRAEAARLRDGAASSVSENKDRQR